MPDPTMNLLFINFLKKMGKVHRIIAILLIITFSSSAILAQIKIVDQVAGVVGGNVILQSDIENTYLQMKAQGMSSQGDMKCEVLEDLLVSKLMLNQAKVDSVEITAAQVERELDSRLQMFIEQIGSQERLEAYYSKSILEIKSDFRELIREQLLTQTMQSNIASEITATPSEIKAFYKKIPKDSLPMIPAQIEYIQLVRNPPYSDQAKLAIRTELLDLRKRVLEGEDFSTLAILYSEDPGSARKGGELGFQGRNELVPEFAEVAFSLKKNAVSPIVETKFGFHIIQLIERKDEKVNVRHILLKPEVTMEEREKAFDFLDSLLVKIRGDSLPFNVAVRIFSEDEDTKLSGGIVVNPRTGDTKFQLDQLDQATAEAIRNLKMDDISEPFESKDFTGTPIFKIIKVTNRIPAHQADLKNDYTILQEMTKRSKQNQELLNWIEEKQEITYIRIDDSYKGCSFKSKGWVK